ncbi:MAG: DMT family transporter, partial [Rhodospirillaceae bacterium]|nr:DMT family transporter [Rhodospirillaceae bacterium]
TAASFAAVAGAFSMAFAMVFVKFLSRTETSIAILAFFSLSAIFTTLIPTITVWQTPSLIQIGWLALVGGLGSMGQYLYIRAYRIGDASVVAPFNFLQLPFAACLGYLVFAEMPGHATLVGGSIIIVSVLYIMRREAVVHRKVNQIPPVA